MASLARIKGKRTRVWIILAVVAASVTLLVLLRGFAPSPVEAQGGTTMPFGEHLSATALCTKGTVGVTAMVTSNESSLVHFPTAVDMTREELRDAVVVMLGFAPSPYNSVLLYEFNTTLEQARTLAEAVTPSIENAFNTHFWYNSSRIRNNYSEVSYLGEGKADLASYVQWLTGQCLASDLGGFSLSFVPAVAGGASPLVSAGKESGGFDWLYSFSVSRAEDLQPGPGPHEIDLLDLLNVNSLQPSPYSQFDSGPYTSTVTVTVTSNQSVSFVSCEPGLVDPFSGQLRGWIYQQMGSNMLTGSFTFANDPSPATSLSFTFSGMVIPEFPALAAFAPVLVVVLGRRMGRR